MRTLTSLLCVAACVATLSLTASAQQPPTQEIEYTVKLTSTQLNAIASGLNELPARIANPLWQHITQQVTVQNMARSNAIAEEQRKRKAAEVAPTVSRTSKTFGPERTAPPESGDNAAVKP